MATKYAVLGGTGNTGLSILRTLSQKPDIQINVLVRSKAKLERLDRTVATLPNLTVFEGDITDVDVVTNCLRGCRAAFLAVAVSQGRLGCRVAQDQANSAVSALSAIRDSDPSAKLPFLVVLSAAEVSPKFFYDPPFPINYLVYGGVYYLYQDLIAAENYVRSKCDWIDAVFVKPGAISQDIARGHIISTEKSQSFVSFLDVAGGMVQLGEEGAEKWAWKDVTVQSHGKARVEWWNFWAIFTGLWYNLYDTARSYLF